YGACEVGQIDDVGHPSGLHVVSAGGVPRSPDEELEEHHRHQARLQEAVRRHLAMDVGYILRAVIIYTADSARGSRATGSVSRIRFMYCSASLVPRSTSSMPATV